MIKTIKKTAVRAVLLALTALVIIFIFYMSAFNAKDSSELSGGLLYIINAFLARFGLGDILTEHVLRKLAHFTEYFVLGSLLYLDVLSFKDSLRLCFFVPLPIGLATAVLDELSQFLSDGRTPKPFDVFIDFSGVFTAVLILLIIFIIINKIRMERSFQKEGRA